MHVNHSVHYLGLFLRTFLYEHPGKIILNFSKNKLYVFDKLTKAYIYFV